MLKVAIFTSFFLLFLIALFGKFWQCLVVYITIMQSKKLDNNIKSQQTATLTQQL